MDINDLEHLRLLLDIEERTRAHGTIFNDIRKHVLEEIHAINAEHAKVNAKKAEEAAKVKAEEDHKAAVAAKAEADKAQHSLPLSNPPSIMSGPPIYPPGSGPIETDTSVPRRV